MFLPINEKQSKFRKLRRDGLPNINIARSFNISRQEVSRALISMDKRVEIILHEMAQANQIEVESINTEQSILFGHSIPLDANTIIFVSAKQGVQVWYEHDGDCGACSRYTQVHQA